VNRLLKPYRLAEIKIAEDCAAHHGLRQVCSSESRSAKPCLAKMDAIQRHAGEISFGEIGP
jgi:hypothetical protein